MRNKSVLFLSWYWYLYTIVKFKVTNNLNSISSKVLFGYEKEKISQVPDPAGAGFAPVDCLTRISAQFRVYGLLVES